MQHVLLTNLKLAEANDVVNYTKCAESVLLPKYSYFVSAEGRERIDAALKKPDVSGLFYSNPMQWMLSTLGTASIAEFERVLHGECPDLRACLTRMMILPLFVNNGDTQDIEWMTADGGNDDESHGNLKPYELPPLSAEEVLSFADYDALVEFFKAKHSDVSIRQLLYSSMLETLYAVESSKMAKFPDVVDVLFQNFIIAMQMMKYACPEEAKRFMSFAMKLFVSKEKD